MRCSQCNAELLDTDTFCPVCGAKQVKEGRCPHCNAMLRPGARFCQSCGKSVNETVFTADQDDPEDEEPEDDVPPIRELETKEIPFEEVEKNIIAEAAHSVKSRDRQEHVSATNIFREKDEAPRPQRGGRQPQPGRPPEQPHRRSEVRIREMRERDDYDYDDEEEDATDKGIMIAMILVGAAIVAAILMVVIMQFMKSGKKNGAMESSAGETAGTVMLPTMGAEGPKEEILSPVLGTVYVTSTKANVRSSPTKEEDNIIGTTGTGDTYDFLGYSENRDWVRIIYSRDGQQEEGYISSSLVQVQETTGE